MCTVQIDHLKYRDVIVDAAAILIIKGMARIESIAVFMMVVIDNESILKR